MKQLLSKEINKIIVFLFIFVFITLPKTALGVGVNPSEMVAPIEGSQGGFDGILVGFFKWGIGLTSVLAVVMIVVGGVQYMGSESLFAKDEGKKRIQAAIGGLILALASILILTTIFGDSGGTFKINLDFKK